jgi:hypothetical protein
MDKKIVKASVNHNSTSITVTVHAVKNKCSEQWKSRTFFIKNINLWKVRGIHHKVIKLKLRIRAKT